MSVIRSILPTILIGFTLGVTLHAAPSESKQEDHSIQSKNPVQVFILMGQSNMFGSGKVGGLSDGALEYAVKEKGLYPYLINDETYMNVGEAMGGCDG